MNHFGPKNRQKKKRDKRKKNIIVENIINSQKRSGGLVAVRYT